MVVLLFSAALLVSCQNNVNTDIEDTLAPYMELEPIEEASNTTLTVRRGTSAGMDSYFAFDVSNVESNGIISEGLVEGWCLEWDKPIAQNNDRHDGVEAYSTFGSEKWKPVNYLMSIKDQLQRTDPSLTYREIQVAMWSLIDVPRFDVDDVLASGRMPSRMMSNGQPNFSVDKVKDILDHVRSNSDTYTYSESTPYMVFARTADNTQNGGFVSCESGDASQCEGFISISGNVYVDADANEVKDASESGIQNTTVMLKDGENEYFEQTDDDGNYSFLIYTNDMEKTFTIEVLSETENPEDFNEELFDTHNATTVPPLLTVTTSISVESQNFGFEPKVDDLIAALTGDTDGDGVKDTDPTIIAESKSRKFWKKQVFLGLIEQTLQEWLQVPVDLQAEIPYEDILSYLNEIEGLLLEEPFQFSQNKLYDAFVILWRNNSDIERLLSELLTAELNVVAGFGTDSPEFDLALLAFGESAAVNLRNDNLPGLRAASKVETYNPNGIPDIESVRTIEDARKVMRQIEQSERTESYISTTTRAIPLSSSLTTYEDAEPLLRAFNLSGGGGGGTIGPR